MTHAFEEIKDLLDCAENLERTGDLDPWDLQVLLAEMSARLASLISNSDLND